MIHYDFFLIDVSQYEIVHQDFRAGRFGTVTLAKKEDQNYIIRSFNDNGNLDKLILREVETLYNLRIHPAIYRFYGYSLHPFQMVFEYLPNGSLQDIFDKIKRGTPVPQWNGTMKSKTIFGILCALHHLHNHDIVHRFLTPACILFDDKNEPRITDFIYSRRTDNSINFTVQQKDKYPYYQAPEIHTERYDKSVDNFSFGMILYHIVSGKQPSESTAYNATKEIIDGKRPEIPSDCNKRLRLFITDLWKNNPLERPQFIDIIKALRNYDNPLFPDTDMNEYKKYRDRLLQSTYFTQDDISFLKAKSYTIQDEEYFDKTLEKAEQNDIPSMLKIARMFEIGIGTDISLQDAIEWYQRAADLNDPEALFKIANFYLTANEILQPSEQKYLEYLKRSCDLGLDIAICDYAHLLSEGSGVEKNIPEAIRLLEGIAKPPKNDKEAQYHLAQIYDSQGDIRKSLDYYDMCIKQNFLPAKADYALFLLKGKGRVHKDVKEGIRLLKKLSQDGYPKASSHLGTIYETGLFDQPININDALSYHNLAIKGGCPNSMVSLGLAYHTKKFGGQPFEKDDIRAARLFERAAELNYPEGLYFWAIFELKGIGNTRVDIPNALKDLTVAANQGCKPALFKLYKLFSEGVYGFKDTDKAKEYLDRACDLGYEKAIKERENLST